MSLLTPNETAAPAQRTTPRGGLRPVPSSTRTTTADASAGTSSSASPAPSTAVASEPALSAVLDELAGEGWTVLHGLSWPGRWSAALANVLVGPGGVVVVDVDARPWRLTADSGLRLGRRDGARECAAAAQRAADVTSLLHREQQGAVRAFLCLTSQPLPAVPVAGGVTASGPRGLAAAVRALPVVLDAVDVRQVSAHLQWQLSAREQRVDRGAAVLGLVPAQRPAADSAAPLGTPSATPAADPAASTPATSASETEASRPVYATRREALAAEREQARQTR